MIEDKEYDERNQISKKGWRKNNWRYRNHETAKIEFAEKYRLSWEIIWRNKSDGYEWWQGIWRREHISKNDEERVTEDIEVLKLGKLSSQKNIDNIEE